MISWQLTEKSLSTKITNWNTTKNEIKINEYCLDSIKYKK